MTNVASSFNVGINHPRKTSLLSRFRHRSKGEEHRRCWQEAPAFERLAAHRSAQPPPFILFENFGRAAFIMNAAYEKPPMPGQLSSPRNLHEY